MAERPKYDQPTVFNFLHDYGCDLRARRIFNHSYMNVSENGHEIGIEYISKNLLHLDKSSGPIELWINNPGGELHEMWAIIDIMQIMSNQVDTICYGNCSSAACLLLASATGTRYALPHSSFMWHSGTTGVSSDMHWADARDRMKWENKEVTAWVDAMARATSPCDEKGRKIKTLQGKIRFWQNNVFNGGELWMNAKEMLKHGVIDEIWSRD